MRMRRVVWKARERSRPDMPARLWTLLRQRLLPHRYLPGTHMCDWRSISNAGGVKRGAAFAPSLKLRCKGTQTAVLLLDKLPSSCRKRCMLPIPAGTVCKPRTFGRRVHD